METSKYVFTYYTLCVQNDDYGSTIIEMGVREVM